MSGRCINDATQRGPRAWGEWRLGSMSAPRCLPRRPCRRASASWIGARGQWTSGSCTLVALPVIPVMYCSRAWMGGGGSPLLSSTYPACSSRVGRARWTFGRHGPLPPWLFAARSSRWEYSPSGGTHSYYEGMILIMWGQRVWGAQKQGHPHKPPTNLRLRGKDPRQGSARPTARAATRAAPSGRAT